MQNIILIAPPAAGKGTLSKKLVDNFNYEYISTGDILREEAKENEKLNDKLKKGILIDDKEVTEALKKKLSLIKRSYILDGFPRTIKQAQDYERWLEENDESLGIVMHLDVSKEELISRINSRMICPNCKRTYSNKEIKLLPKKAGFCDDCDVELITRSDDNIDVFNKRYQEYLDKTSKLVLYYKEKGKLVTIKTLTPDETYQEAKKIIEVLND